MREAKVFVNGFEAGVLRELVFDKRYQFEYLPGYSGPPVSLTMPRDLQTYDYNNFPPFFDGLLPEGYQLEGLLRNRKIDYNDNFSQLMAVGNDLVGNVEVREIQK